MLFVVGQSTIMDKKLFKEINQIIEDYKSSYIEIIDGLSYNQFETLKKIEFYWNSRYLNGQKDELGKTKPFYNISKLATNVATRATDLDIKDVRITSDNPDDRVRSMILNHELKNWFKEANFSYTLNTFGKTRAKYGGALVKKTVTDGKLNIEVVDWKNVITGQTSVENETIIEVHYMSPSELSKKRGIWENVDEAIEFAKKRNNKNDTNDDKITVYEVHGEFPQSLNPDIENGDENTYERMVYFIAGENETEQVVLWYEQEKESPYRFLAWDNVPGRALGIGVVEDGFEAQMWTNDAVMAEKNVMDLAGKVFIKTNSEQIGNNALTDLENGAVIKLEDGADANVMNLTPNSLPQFQNTIERWRAQYERATNTFDAVTGETLPSNTALGSVAIQSAQASSFFDYRREEAGIFWKNVLMDWVIPHLIKKINKKHILASDFSADEIKLIDTAFSINEANTRLKEAVLSGKIVTQEEYDQAIEAFRTFIAEDGKRRYLDVPEDYFKGYEKKVSIDITGESRNKQAQLQSLSTILSQVASNPGILQDPNLNKIFNEILELSGINFIPVQPQRAGNVGNVQAPPQPALDRQTQGVLPEAQQ